MKRCTFFGHADAPQSVVPIITQITTKLINDDVTIFYVGTQGQFDRYCYRVLKELQKEFKNICVYRVLAYMPKDGGLAEDSILPEGIEIVPKRFAISWRNKWMINNCDYVITYVTRDFGGASMFKELAIKKGKIVFNIDEYIK